MRERAGVIIIVEPQKNEGFLLYEYTPDRRRKKSMRVQVNEKDEGRSTRLGKENAESSNATRAVGTPSRKKRAWR